MLDEGIFELFAEQKDVRCVQGIERSKSILQAMIAKVGGRFNGCKNGGCGACKVRILCGEWRVVRQMSRIHVTADDEENGIVLGCCVTPQTTLRVQSLGKCNAWVRCGSVPNS